MGSRDSTHPFHPPLHLLTNPTTHEIMPPSSSSPRRRRTTLFNKDGISLFATILPSTDNDDEDQVDDNDGASPPHQNHDGIILTLALNRQQSKNVINPTMISLLIQVIQMQVLIQLHFILILTILRV